MKKMSIHVARARVARTTMPADVSALAPLSKAALLDLLIEALRLNAGQCDTPCPIETVREFCNPTLAARGDRPI
jgi:hypothetical protein